jgi:integral membrane protein (TIGR00529 family)
MIWSSFIIAIGALIIISRKNLWLGMLVSGLILGLANLSIKNVSSIFMGTVTDGSVFLLAIAVSIIPLIGGIVQQSGMLESMTNSLQINRRLFLVLSPALLGFMPIPGGALLSCPLIEKAGDDIKKEEYVAINIWFRHLLIIIYPLSSSLLVCAKMAGISLYTAVLYLLPAPIIMGVLGYYFLLRKIKGNMSNATLSVEQNKFKAIAKPVFIFLSAPLIHASLLGFGTFPFSEIPMLIGLLFSLSIALCFAKTDFKGLKKAFFIMKPYRFFLLILGIFFFLNVFTATKIVPLIAELTLPKHFLIIALAFIMSFFTGRIQVGFSIIFPVFIARFGEIDIFQFVLFYMSVFLGYLVSPVHPCLSLSLEYFKTSYTQVMKRLAIPVMIVFIILYVLAIFI